MNQQKILSICIPTYNRGEKLVSLVESILLCESQEFDIEITDNSSTDDTLDKLRNIKDNRVIIHENASNIGGAANMIKSIFNVKNKYAFYCNDRDSIDYTKLPQLIQFLKDNELSYIKINDSSKKEEVSYAKIYNKGYASVLNQSYTFHPTGCIFNCNLMRQHNFLQHEYSNWAGTEKYCKLAWDLMWYGETAILNKGLWAYAAPEYIADNISDYQKKANKNCKTVYYHPSERTRNMKLIMSYLLGASKNCRFLNSKEKNSLALSIAEEFYENIKYYKYNACSIFETSHYQIERRFVSTLELIKLYREYSREVIVMMQKCDIAKDVIAEWKEKEGYRILKLIKASLFYDIYFIKKTICKEKW